MMYVDVPTNDEMEALARHRSDLCVSITLPTTPITADTDGDRILLGNLVRDALAQADAAKIDRRRVEATAEALADLVDDDDFWRVQARSLVVYATPDEVRTYRVPSALTAQVAVSDRFHLKPLLLARTFPHACRVLALAIGGARLLEISADLPTAEIRVPDLPRDAASAVGKASIGQRSFSGRLGGSEGRTVRMRQYARKVEAALRGVLASADVPLVLAAAEPIASIYRSVNTYPHLLPEGVDGNPEGEADGALATAARNVLDRAYAGQLAEWRDLYHEREANGRATKDIAHAARAATFGMIDTVMVDMDRAIPGTVDDESGAVTFAEGASAVSYGVADEIARRALLAGGRVLSVRSGDIPGGGDLAAILRYPLR